MCRTMAAILAEEHIGSLHEPEESITAAEEKLMRRLESLPAQTAKKDKRRLRWNSLPVVIAAACAVVLLCLIVVLYGSQWSTDLARRVPPVVPPKIPQTGSSSGQGTALEETLKRAEDENAGLKSQLAQSEAHAKQSDSSVANFEKRLETEEASLNRANQDRDDLNVQLTAAKAEVESFRRQFTEASSTSGHVSAQLASLEVKVRELSSSLEERDTELNEKSQMLDLDKDLLAHDRDIRDVIGARNLYIADISDLNANGKTAKQFGRIFYTKDRSLLFYGFDLDSQANHKSEVSFQAWGSGSDTPAPLSLGLFYLDDAHKRWVLRCNDPKTLARLDMVFVTVEPPGGSPKPTGKQLLRAYLQIQPNHP